ncbi:MAG: class I SAM-dependent methyltransferase [Egibacteraceae bacterium]
MTYWEERYRKGGFSGAGSRGAEAREKIALVNEVAGINRVETLLDLGCGDGHVAAGLSVSRYTGYDPAPAAVALAREERPSGDFITQLPPEGTRFDLVLSMDVMFHLVKDADYQAYLAALFGYGDLVLVYGTDKHLEGHHHVLHREWTKDIPPGWSRRELPTTFKRAWLLRRDR